MPIIVETRAAKTAAAASNREALAQKAKECEELSINVQQAQSLAYQVSTKLDQAWETIAGHDSLVRKLTARTEEAENRMQQ